MYRQITCKMLLVLTLVLTLMVPRVPVHAQVFEVIEVGPQLVQSTISAVNNVVTALQAVILVANSFLELAGLDGTSLEGLAALTEEFAALMDDTNALLWDIRVIDTQIKALFDLETAPDNMTDLQARLADIRRETQKVLTAARRLQTIQRAAVDGVQRIIKIYNRIADLVGNRQSQAQMQEQLTLLVKAEHETGASIAAYQQAMLMDKQAEPLVQESLERINIEILKDWPGNERRLP